MLKSNRGVIFASIGTLIGIFIAFIIKGIWTNTFEWESLARLLIGGIIGMVLLFILIKNGERRREEENKL